MLLFLTDQRCNILLAPGHMMLIDSMCPPQGSLSISQLQQVEKRVNDIISANQIVHSQELPLQTAWCIGGLRTVDEVNSSLSACLSFCLPACLYLCLSVSLPVYLSAGVS